MSPAGCIESKLLRAVVPSTKLTIETVYMVISILTIRLVRAYTKRVKGSISVTPQLEPLNCAYSLHLAKAVRTSMNVCPDNVDIVKVDQVLPAQISLELDRAFDCCEFVSDCDVLIVYANSFISGISNPVRFLKCHVTFHIGSVVVWAMAGVQRMRMYIRGGI